MSGTIERLKREFHSEDYRYAYDEEFSNAQLATQIKVLREQRGLTQAELAESSEMKQSRISALENVNYSAWSVSTLRRLARALGVRFAFRFESWAEMLPEIGQFGRDLLKRPSFSEDPVFHQDHRKTRKRAKKVAPQKQLVHTTDTNATRNFHLVGSTYQPPLFDYKNKPDLRAVASSVDSNAEQLGSTGTPVKIVDHTRNTNNPTIAKESTEYARVA